LLCVRLLLSFFFSSRRRHTRFSRDWSSDVCSSELMTPEQQTWFKETFGFKDVRSPVYASNDALVNGYACAHCGNGEFHVPTRLMDIEIFKTEEDKPVRNREVGRLLVTKKGVQDPDLRRYDIGDLAQWIDEPCPCGHQTPKFRLMGRFDIALASGKTPPIVDL